MKHAGSIIGSGRRTVGHPRSRVNNTANQTQTTPRTTRVFSNSLNSNSLFVPGSILKASTPAPNSQSTLTINNAILTKPPVLPKPIVSRTNTSSNSVMRPSDKNSLARQILVLGDSHARDTAYHLQNLLNQKDFNVFSLCRPSAKISDVLKDVDQFAKDLTKVDFAILIAGSNDIEQGKRTVLTDEVREKLAYLRNKTNLIVVKMPPRHDRNDLNETISHCNDYLCRDKTLLGCNFVGFDNFDRSFFSKQGQHLNKKGKLTLCKYLMRTVVNIVVNRLDGHVSQDSFLA